MAYSSACRIFGLSNGGCRWFGRIMVTLPVGLVVTTLTPRALVSSGSRSTVGFSHQSCSPDCMDATLVLSSGIVVHSTRSKYATFGPAVHVGVPPWRG